MVINRFIPHAKRLNATMNGIIGFAGMKVALRRECMILMLKASFGLKNSWVGSAVKCVQELRLHSLEWLEDDISPSFNVPMTLIKLCRKNLEWKKSPNADAPMWVDLFERLPAPDLLLKIQTFRPALSSTHWM